MYKYKNKKEQIENIFYNDIFNGTYKKEIPIAIRRRIKENLKNAAIVGAVEERGRILRLINDCENINCLYEKINSCNILKVLGYK